MTLTLTLISYENKKHETISNKPNALFGWFLKSQKLVLNLD